ncbi:hypothetical protein OG21DRAFT_1509118 [Imleria badia]|nr:hypothetical protein OG21DRAFT_1509118 [Imleria badia]
MAGIRTTEGSMSWVSLIVYFTFTVFRIWDHIVVGTPNGFPQTQRLSFRPFLEAEHTASTIRLVYGHAKDSREIKTGDDAETCGVVLGTPATRGMQGWCSRPGL